MALSMARYYFIPFILCLGLHYDAVVHKVADGVKTGESLFLSWHDQSSSLRSSITPAVHAVAHGECLNSSHIP